MEHRQVTVPFRFVIDTTQYSGSFERPLCAWITGVVGDCEVGRGDAILAKTQLSDNDKRWFDLRTLQVPDDRGCFRPCSIYPTEGWVNNGRGEIVKDSPDLDVSEFYLKRRWPAYHSVVIYFDEAPSDERIALMKGRAYSFCTRIEDNPEEDWGKFAPRLSRDEITGFRLISEKQAVASTNV